MALLKATIYAIASTLLVPLDIFLWGYCKPYRRYVFRTCVRARENQQAMEKVRQRRVAELERQGVNVAYVRMVAGKGRRN